MESKINVSLRIKPLSESEAANEKNHMWVKIADNSILNKRTNEVFQYDKVFGDDANTADIFDSQIKEIVQAAMNGINQTVFAYGQTSSGKTHTMKGSPSSKSATASRDSRGIIPLSIMEIFRLAQKEPKTGDSDQAMVREKAAGREYSISVSYLEIYNECVNDLIDPANKNLEVRETISNGICINRLTEKKVNSFEEVMKYMEQGDEFRNIAATKLNELSSRSHTVFRISISSQESISDSSGIQRAKMKISQLNLVDLAGSEGASKTQAEGIRLREGQNINRSLLALSNVINRLSSQVGSGKSFINYRDSKLTRILQSSLGGNSQTAIICTMTQTCQNHQETVNTLLFGQKAKNVKTTVNVNEVAVKFSAANASSGELHAELEKQSKTILDLQSKIKELEGGARAASKKGKQLVKQEDAPSSPQHQQSSEYLQSQVQFLGEQLRKSQDELEQKDLAIQKILIEKTEYAKKFDQLEIHNGQLQETIQFLEREKVEQDKVNKNLQLIATAQNLTRKTLSPRRKDAPRQNQMILEEDGVACFDLDVLGSDAQEDLRLSLGLGQGPYDLDQVSQDSRSTKRRKRDQKADQSLSLSLNSKISPITHHPPFTAGGESEIPGCCITEGCSEAELLSQLERSRQEYDEIQKQRQQIERCKQEQQLEVTIEMRETIEQLKEEALFKNEQLAKYEKKLHQLDQEAVFYRQQNQELVKKLDELEAQSATAEINSFQCGNSSASSAKIIILNDSKLDLKKNEMLKTQNGALTAQVETLKKDLRENDLEKKRLESLKADIEYNLRACEYNVEILKNKNENLNTEMSLVKRQLEKQKKYSQALKQKNERLAIDLQSYKGNATAAGGGAAAQVGQKRSKSDVEKLMVKAERPGRQSSSNRAQADDNKMQKPEHEAENSTLLMDINDSFIFKESPARRGATPEAQQMQHTRQQEAIELENIISEKDTLIEKMKDEFDGAETKIQSLQLQLRELRSQPQSGAEPDEVEKSSIVTTPSRNQHRKQRDSTSACFKEKQGTPEKDLIKKFKYDNQILLKRLSEYKKAEKGAVQIVKDYDQMKLKYFQVLQENQSQKLSVQDLMEKDHELRRKVKQHDEQKKRAESQLREMKDEVRKMVAEESDKNGKALSELRDQVERLQSSEVEMKERDAQRQMEQSRQREVLLQVDKHLKTLVRRLRSVVESTQDPVIIEHQQRQINNIEKIHAEVQALNVYGNLNPTFTLKSVSQSYQFEESPSRASLRARRKSRGPRKSSARQIDESLFTEADTLNDC